MFADDLQVRAWSRRQACLALSGGLIALCGVESAEAESNNTTKGGAWLLGDNLSLAALLYDQSASQALVDKSLARAKTIADIFGVTIKPFPAKARTKAESSADMLHYLIAGDGAQIGVALGKKYDVTHEILFEVAVKSNLLIILYAPGDKLGLSVAEVIRKRLGSVDLPRNVWSDVVTLIEEKRPQQQVKDAVFKMHKDIANYYIPGSG